MNQNLVAGEAKRASRSASRLAYFDVAEFIAIVAVIVGHTALRFVDSSLSRQAIAVTFSFHLPLFFIVGGFFLHVDRPFGARESFRRLGVPYVVTAVAVVILAAVTNLILKDQGSTKALIVSWANAAIFGAGDLVSNPLWPQSMRIGAIWFLLALFWCRLFVASAYRTPCPWLVVFVYFIVGYVSVRWVFLPLSIQPALCASLFMYVGTLARRGNWFGDGSVSRFERAIVVLLWAFAMAGATGFGMAVNSYGIYATDVVRNIVGGVAGTWCVIVGCRAIELKTPFGGGSLWRLVSRLGELSLLILCVHLVEDNVVRWEAIALATKGVTGTGPGWLLVLFARLVVDVFMALVLARVPLVCKVFGVRSAEGEAGDAHDNR